MPKVKQKGKDLEVLCGGMIGKVVCLRLQERWSKQVTTLLVSIIRYGGVLEVRDGDIRIAWKSYYENLLNTECA